MAPSQYQVYQASEQSGSHSLKQPNHGLAVPSNLCRKEESKHKDPSIHSLLISHAPLPVLPVCRPDTKDQVHGTKQLKRRGNPTRTRAPKNTEPRTQNPGILQQTETEPTDSQTASQQTTHAPVIIQIIGPVTGPGIFCRLLYCVHTYNRGDLSSYLCMAWPR